MYYDIDKDYKIVDIYIEDYEYGKWVHEGLTYEEAREFAEQLLKEIEEDERR